ncbi:MAG TPA: hypothetical protein VF184_09010, partial [Phycisphaeraceae bacterium]
MLALIIRGISGRKHAPLDMLRAAGDAEADPSVFPCGSDTESVTFNLISANENQDNDGVSRNIVVATSARMLTESQRLFLPWTVDHQPEHTACPGHSAAEPKQVNRTWQKG